MKEYKEGALHIVGSGIKSIAHITTEARNLMKSADKLLYVVSDPLTKDYLLKLNSTAEDMAVFYEEDKHREITYKEMAEYSLSFVRKGMEVCVAYYGHPGVFVAPSHIAVKAAREEGYFVQMLPGISAEDCMFCDLGFDPARQGCQSFEVTDFLIYNRKFDPNCNLILWQVGVIANLNFQKKYDSSAGLSVLTDYLLDFYPKDHVIVIYEASLYDVCKPMMNHIELKDLPNSPVSPISTLYLPPLNTAFNADLDMMKKLQIPERFLNQSISNSLITSSVFDKNFSS